MSKSLNKKKITIDDDIAFTRITSSIICENYDVLIIFFMNRISSAYYAYIYNYELIKLNGFQYVGSITIPDDFYNGLFFKALSLHYGYGTFLYFYDPSHFMVRIFRLNIDSYTFNEILVYSNNCDLDPTITLNEFLKIDDERLVFISILQLHLMEFLIKNYLFYFLIFTKIISL